MAALASLMILLTLAGATGPTGETTISIVGTSDLHGHIAVLPWFAGYLRNLRAARAGAVVVLDAGDMFQGTLESNLAEGAPVVDAYNALGYSGAAIGNHEFDFGPVGPAPSPTSPKDDPRGALKARAAQARFPFLAANIVDKATRKPVAWPNVVPSKLIDVDGIKVGLVGVTTASAARSSLPANITGLAFEPLETAITREARRLRARGAKVVVAVAHEGGACQSFDDPDVLASCDARSEIFSVAARLPKGSVDAIVAGHTHQAVAQRLAGIPIIQSYCNGRAFGRVDLTVERASGKVVSSHLDAPREICPASKPETCKPGEYLGRAVQKDAALATLIGPAFAAAQKKAEEKLGLEVRATLPHNRARETALGNLLADLMRAARPGADVAMINGGGMRAGLPPGPLTFGHLYETFPFDNAFATMSISAGEFRRLLARSLARSPSLVSLSGVRVQARCKQQQLEAELVRADGTPLPDQTILKLVTTDFLATGGDGFFADTNLESEIGPTIRDEIAEALRKRGGTLDPDDLSLFDPARPRFDLPGPIPLRCD
jgi:2',3'-cyclic-nucleotide 2'-phosphodiesterase (5'-nucleotidase family)